jgi:hypothetical protein
MPTLAPIGSRTRKLILALSSFSAVSAIAGGIALIFSRPESPYSPPLRLLEHTPFADFVVPGLLLAIVVGGTSLICATLASRRSPRTIDAAIVAGGALTVWIVAEVAMFRSIHWLHVACGAIGLSILGLGLAAAWRSGETRHRWVISVTFAETIGYLAPSCAGVLSAKAEIGELAQVAVMVAAGFVEGLALGLGQAWALPLRIRRWRYVLLTALAASVVWLCVMSMMIVAGSGVLPNVLLVPAGLFIAIVGLGAIGTAQSIELRRHADAAYRWIPWTALAWSLALPLSFAPGPFVDESTPLASHLLLWGCGGLLMAYVMALVTWQGVRRLSGEKSLRHRFFAEIATLDLPEPAAPSTPITEADLSALPEPARRYLRFMGVVGRPRDRSFRAGFRGRFKVGHHARWRACEVWQYDTSPEVTRNFLMRLRFAGLPVIGRDSYRDGRGRMLGKVLDRLTVIDGQGEALDLGELSTYLNDLVLVAPSMLLVPAVSFAPVDASSFDVTIHDHGVTVTARVSVDERGAPLDFETTDRFCQDPKDRTRLVRARWTTPVSGFEDVDGRKLPTRARAIWHLPEGELPYAELELVPGSVAFNVRPGE